MQENYLFEYAVIRLVPRVEREEFLNVGIILYCNELKFLKAKVILDQPRLEALDPRADTQLVHEHLDSLMRIAEGDANAGEIAQLAIPLRFRWLTAARSTIVQTSKVHPGFCKDPNDMMERLLKEMVLLETE